MRQLTSLLFILMTTSLFAAKTFSHEIIIYSVATMKPLEGITVRCISTDDSRTVVEKVTDSYGFVVFNGLSKKDYSFWAIDTSGEYRDTEIYYYNPKRHNLMESAYMSFNPSKEDSLIAERTKSIPYDSTDFIKCPKENWTDPEFPGGMKEMNTSFVHNMRYPQTAIEENIRGKVYLSFVIEADGNLTNLKVLRGVHKELDAEAIRIVSYLSDWQPAKCNGEPVRAKFVLPVSFSLE
jgi:TonB family protein